MLPSIARREFLKRLGGTAAILAAARHAAAQGGPAPRTYTYKTANGHEIKADVHGPNNTEKKPTLIWIHGGGLISGIRTGIPRFARDLAQREKFAVVSIDYRLAPNTKLPAIIEDVVDAHRWVREKGPRLFGADPDRIAVAGGSAGGYLTLMAGFRFDPRPKALVSYYGYGDITAPWYSRPDPFYLKQPLVPKEEALAAVGDMEVSAPTAGNKRGRFYLYCRQQGIWPKEVAGHDPDTENGWFDPYCPARNVTKDYPPTLLIHGTKDTDVPYEQSMEMGKKLAELELEHELITVPDAGHGLTGVPQVMVQAIDDRAIAFVKKHVG